jgi:uncharacterized protein
VRQTPNRSSAALPRLVISVHDVAPSSAGDVRWLLDRLDDLGAAPRVLKVIPREPGSRPLEEDAVLVALLVREVAAGSEVVLHGYTHKAAGGLRGPVAMRLRARLAAGVAAEFLTLAPGAAAERVSAGLAVLDRLGIRPAGFCAPGWLATPEIDGILAAAGFRYSLTFAALRDLRTGRARSIPALGYMGAGPVQERLVGVERRLLLAGRGAFPVLRVFLHPAGARHSVACRATLDAVERLCRERRPVTYANLLHG